MVLKMKALLVCFGSAVALHTLSMTSATGNFGAVKEAYDRAIQAMIVLGFLLYFLALVWSCLIHVRVCPLKYDSSNFQLIIVSLIAVVGAICTIIGVAIYHSELDSYSLKHGSPFPYNTTVYVFGAISAITGAILSCVIMYRAALPNEPATQGDVAVGLTLTPQIQSPPQAQILSPHQGQIQSPPQAQALSVHYQNPQQQYVYPGGPLPGQGQNLGQGQVKGQIPNMGQGQTRGHEW